MNLQDAYLDDLETAFFDLDEFASEHVIDGVPMTVVLLNANFQNAKTSYGSRKAALNPKETAINRESMILCIKTSDSMRKKYTVNAMINLDGKEMFVYEAKQMTGMYRLLIGRHRV